MMQTILLRKYDVPSQKHAKRIIDQARVNLDCDRNNGDRENQSTNVLWSKELEEECARVWRRSAADERARKEAERAVPDVKPVVYQRPRQASSNDASSLGLSVSTAHTNTSRGTTGSQMASPVRQRRASTSTTSMPQTNIATRRSSSPLKYTDNTPNTQPAIAFSPSTSTSKNAVIRVSTLPQPTLALATNMRSPIKTRTNLEPDFSVNAELRTSTIAPLNASTTDTVPNSQHRRQRSPSPSARAKPSPSSRLKSNVVTKDEPCALTTSSQLRLKRSDQLDVDNSQLTVQEKSLRSTRTSVALGMAPRLSSPVRERRNCNIVGDKSTRSTRTSVTACDVRTPSPPKGYRADPRNDVSVRSAAARTVAMDYTMRSSSPTRAERSLRASRTVAMDPRSNRTNEEKSLRATRTVAMEHERASSPTRGKRSQSEAVKEKSIRTTRTVDMEQVRTCSPTREKRSQSEVVKEKSIRATRTVAMEHVRVTSPTRELRSQSEAVKEKSIRTTRTVAVEHMRVTSPTRELRSQSEAVKEKSIRTTRTVAIESRSPSARRAQRSGTESVKEKSHRGTRTVEMEQRSSSPSKRAERTVGNEYEQEKSLRCTRTVALEQRSSSPSRVMRSQVESKERSLRGTRTVAMESRSSSPSLRATRTIPLEIRSTSPTRDSRSSRLDDKLYANGGNVPSTLNTAVPQQRSSSSPSKAQRHDNLERGLNDSSTCSKPKPKEQEGKVIRSTLDSTVASPSREKRSDGTSSGASSSSKSPSKLSSKSVNDREACKQVATPSEIKSASVTAAPYSSSPFKDNQGNKMDASNTHGSCSVKSKPKRSIGVSKQLSSSLSMLDTSGIACSKSPRVLEQYAASPSKNKRTDNGLGSRSSHSYSSPKRTSKRIEARKNASNGSSDPARNGSSSNDTNNFLPVQSSRSPILSQLIVSPSKRLSVTGITFYSSSMEEAAKAGHQSLGERESTASLKEKMHGILSSPTPRAKAKLRRFQTTTRQDDDDDDDDASASSHEDVPMEINTAKLEWPSPPTSPPKRTSATVVLRKVQKSPMRAKVKLPNFDDSVVSFADFDSFVLDAPSVTVQSDTAQDTDKLENMFRDMGRPQTTTRCNVSVKCQPHQNLRQVEYHLSPTAPSGIGSNVPLKVRKVEDLPDAKNLQKMLNTFDDIPRKSNRMEDGCVTVTSGGSKKAMIPNVQPVKKVAKGSGTPIKSFGVGSPRAPGRINWVNSLSTPVSPKSSRIDSSQRHAVPTASLSGFGESFLNTSHTGFSLENVIESSHERNRWISDPLAKRSAHQSTTASETSTRDSSMGLSSVSTFADQESYESSSQQSDSNKDGFGILFKGSSIPTTSKIPCRLNKGPRTVQRQKSSDGTMLRKMRPNGIDLYTPSSSATSTEFGSHINQSFHSIAQGGAIKARRTMKIKKEKSVKHLGAKNPSQIRSRG